MAADLGDKDVLRKDTRHGTFDKRSLKDFQSSCICVQLVCVPGPNLNSALPSVVPLPCCEDIAGVLESGTRGCRASLAISCASLPWLASVAMSSVLENSSSPGLEICNQQHALVEAKSTLTHPGEFCNLYVTKCCRTCLQASSQCLGRDVALLLILLDFSSLCLHSKQLLRSLARFPYVTIDSGSACHNSSKTC